MQRRTGKIGAGNGLSPTDPIERLRKEVNSAFQQLNDNQVQVGKVLNERRQAIEQAFVLVDAHQHVGRRVMNDIVSGRVQTQPVDPGESQQIDYEWYFTQYNLYVAIIYAFSALRTAREEDKPKAQEVQSKESSNDLDFGGDYAN